mmetsp:Transcript_37635/g.100098  ORF Transcript_37635/g.100098 Transcript_37635/m.100098 type:complete len:226 (-) Transcript_37635:117-794(-)|eukprot:CAMPEP_0194504940 /NCGR_PEP_ID=MMETSP0253-20130528/30543_1 /TAXON_ID=2966 /ORGANISM="Noctiluca scintillans" /LENGTH=225 /DNA_ID=CAMNT_0039347411 /DNA_START=53 /DNA_END=730 /DNA_ORIENTATION=+
MGATLGAEEDANRYRDGYPGLEEQESPHEVLNVRFYKNEIRSIPDGDFVDNIHVKWFGRYDLLEQHHGYIQWLFPIREPGMNGESQPLTSYEAEEMRGLPEVRERLIRSYRLMLDFYGMELLSEGVVGRSMRYEERYLNLSVRGHNFLRITRIIKSLGELGLDHFQGALCQHFVHEVFVEKSLPICKDSLVRYWIPVVKNNTRRQELQAMVERYCPAPKGDVKGS